MAGKYAILILEIILAIKYHAPHCPFFQAMDCHKIKAKLFHFFHGDHRHPVRHYINIRIHLPARNSRSHLFKIIDTVNQGHLCPQLVRAGHTFHGIVKSIDSPAFCPGNHNAVSSVHCGKGCFYLGQVNIH